MLGEKKKKYGVGEESEYESFTEPEKPWFKQGKQPDVKTGIISMVGFWILMFMVFFILSLLGALFE